MSDLSVFCLGIVLSCLAVAGTVIHFRLALVNRVTRVRFAQAQRAHERYGIIQLEQEERFLRHYALLTVLEEQGVNLRGPVPQWDELSEDMREALRIMIFVIYFEGPGQLYLRFLARRQDREALTEMRHYWQDLQLIAA